MRILAADDEALALEMLTDAIKGAGQVIIRSATLKK